MGFELYIQCFGKTEQLGIPLSAVRALFPIVEEKSEPNYWRFWYDSKNSCEVGITATPSNPEMLSGLFVNRPCSDFRLWDALFSVLSMGSVVVFWPGGPPVVAAGTSSEKLPEDMVVALGSPRIADSAADLLRLVQE